jgi:HlyD family secretion protein
VTALGRLQPAGGVVPVHGPPGDRIASLEPLAPGQLLEAGAPIATLASKAEREKEVRVAEVQLEESQKAVDAAKAAGEQKITAARAELNQLLAGKESDRVALKAKTDFVRKQRVAATAQLKRLTDTKGMGNPIAQEDIDKAQLVVDQANAELTAAEAAEEKAKAAYEENEKAANARIKAAEAELIEAEAKVPLASARERLELARHLLGLTTIRAPIRGRVLRVVGHEGQPTGLEPIIQMASLDRMAAIAEVYESDVRRLTDWVRAGPVGADVTAPALPGPLKGTVRSEQDITRMIARNQVFAVGPREDADRRVIEVTVHLDEQSTSIAAQFVGLQVTVSMGK